MADEKELEVDNPGKKKMIMIIAIVAVLVIGGAAAFFLMGGDDSDSSVPSASSSSSSDSAGDSAKETEQAKVGTALYVAMPRHFRFNVPGSLRDRFVEIRAQLLVRGAENEEIAKKHIPLIESTLLAVFSRSNAEDLATVAGKAQLKENALVDVQKVMQEIEDKAIVEQVLFTGFVMQ